MRSYKYDIVTQLMKMSIFKESMDFCKKRTCYKALGMNAEIWYIWPLGSEFSYSLSN